MVSCTTLRIYYLLIFITSVLLLKNVHGRENGAPCSSVENLMPGIGIGHTNRNLKKPSTIMSLSVKIAGKSGMLKINCYEKEDHVIVMINSTIPFKGFLIQARAEKDPTRRLGEFIIKNNPTTRYQCDEMAAATHTSKKDKKHVELTWKNSYIDSKESVVFKAIVVTDPNLPYYELEAKSLTFGCKKEPTKPKTQAPEIETAPDGTVTKALAFEKGSSTKPKILKTEAPRVIITPGPSSAQLISRYTSHSPSTTNILSSVNSSSLLGTFTSGFANKSSISLVKSSTSASTSAKSSVSSGPSASPIAGPNASFSAGPSASPAAGPNATFSAGSSGSPVAGSNASFSAGSSDSPVAGPNATFSAGPSASPSDNTSSNDKSSPVSSIPTSAFLTSSSVSVATISGSNVVEPEPGLRAKRKLHGIKSRRGFESLEQKNQAKRRGLKFH